MKLSPSIFREYDIRGVVGVDFDQQFASLLGQVFAKHLWEDAVGERIPRIAVGYDCRLSSDELKRALIDGLRAGGVTVLDAGMGPSPQLYYVVVSGELDGGIQVTGSHNPGDQNGFKMMRTGRTLSGDDIRRIRRDVEALASGTTLLSLGATGLSSGATGPERPAGQLIERPAREDYLRELVSRSREFMGKRRLKVVVDGGNGVGGLIGPSLLRELGCEVIELFTEPDGRFPNHHPDPTVIENLKDLQKLVEREQADLGIAWDGDADRIGVVDERGEPVFGDMLLILYGRQLLKSVPHPTIIADVKCSDLMFSDLRKRGANTVMCRTGHSLIKAKMKELHADLAGEMSGHIFFGNRYFGFDDALHASARLVEILSSAEGPLSSLLADLPKVVSTPEIRFDCPEDIKFALAECAKTAFPEYPVDTLDGVRISFPHGWGLVRASNTQAVLVMRFEATSPAELKEYQTLVEARVRKIQQELSQK